MNTKGPSQMWHTLLTWVHSGQCGVPLWRQPPRPVTLHCSHVTACSAPHYFRKTTTQTATRIYTERARHSTCLRRSHALRPPLCLLTLHCAPKEKTMVMCWTVQGMHNEVWVWSWFGLDGFSWVLGWVKFWFNHWNSTVYTWGIVYYYFNPDLC